MCTKNSGTDLFWAQLNDFVSNIDRVVLHIFMQLRDNSIIIIITDQHLLYKLIYVF